MRVCGFVSNICPKGDGEGNGRGQDSPLLVVVVVDLRVWVKSYGLWPRFLGASSPSLSIPSSLWFALFMLPQCIPSHFMSTSKSSTSSLVSSVPLRLPTAHTNLVLEARMRHTTPPLPPLSRVTRLRINSPVFRSHSFTVPSSELVMTKFLLNCRHVTALWCLWGPGHKETNMD